MQLRRLHQYCIGSAACACIALVQLAAAVNLDIVATGYEIVDISPSGKHVLLLAEHLDGVDQYVIASVDDGAPDDALTQALHDLLSDLLIDVPRARFLGFVGEDQIGVGLGMPPRLYQLDLSVPSRTPIYERDQIDECFERYRFCGRDLDHVFYSPSGDVTVLVFSDSAAGTQFTTMGFLRDGRVIGLYYEDDPARRALSSGQFAFDLEEDLLVAHIDGLIAIVPVRTNELERIPWHAADEGELLGYLGDGSIAVVQDSHVVGFDRSRLQPSLPQTEGFAPPRLGLPDGEPVVRLDRSFPSTFRVVPRGRHSGGVSSLSVLAFRDHDSLLIYDYVRQVVLHNIDLPGALGGFDGDIRGDRVLIDGTGTRFSFQAWVPGPATAFTPVALVFRSVLLE